jgi:hypothetical protein
MVHHCKPKFSDMSMLALGCTILFWSFGASELVMDAKIN